MAKHATRYHPRGAHGSGARWISRRAFLTQTAAASVAAIGIPSAFASRAGAQTAGVLKIGLLASYTGPFAIYGNEIIEPTIRLYLDQINYSAAGRRIQLIVEDDAADPALALTKARKLVEQDGVELIIGIVSSAVAHALRDYINRVQVPMVTTIGASTEVRVFPGPYIFHAGFLPGQLDPAGAWWAYRKLGFKRIITLGSNFVAPRNILGAFSSTFKQLGGTVVNEFWPPLGTTDFAPYLATIASSAGSVDAIIPVVFGTDALRFAQQYREFGLTGRLAVYTTGDVFEMNFLRRMGDAPLGFKTYWHYSPLLDLPENKAFVRMWQSKFRFLPGCFNVQSYNGIRAVVGALEAIKGRPPKDPAFLRALRSVRFQSPYGPFAFDDVHGISVTLYLCEVKRAGGVITQVPAGDTLSNVNQSWTLARVEK